MRRLQGHPVLRSDLSSATVVCLHNLSKYRGESCRWHLDRSPVAILHGFVKVILQRQVLPLINDDGGNLRFVPNIARLAKRHVCLPEMSPRINFSLPLRPPKMGVALYAAGVFGRTVAGSFHADRVLRAFFCWLDFFYEKVVLPVVAKVVFIGEA